MDITTIKCENCGDYAEVFTTDYPCTYCMENDTCINASMDTRICTDLSVVKCKCGLIELV